MKKKFIVHFSFDREIEEENESAALGRALLDVQCGTSETSNLIVGVTGTKPVEEIPIPVAEEKLLSPSADFLDELPF